MVSSLPNRNVAEFIRRFIELAEPLERVPENILMGQFINGLRKDIRAEVRMLGLHSLEQVMDLAQKVGVKNRARPSIMGEGKVHYSHS